MTWYNSAYQDQGRGYNGLLRLVNHTVYAVAKPTEKEKNCLSEPIVQNKSTAAAVTASKNKTKLKRDISNGTTDASRSKFSAKQRKIDLKPSGEEKSDKISVKQRKNDLKPSGEGKSGDMTKNRASEIKRLKTEEKISVFDEVFDDSESDMSE
jgi:hypothetical protein